MGLATPRSKRWPEPLLEWHCGKSRRRFSFRRRPTAFRILVAELLLRKTRARDVDVVFPRVMMRYPDVAHLAQAHEADLRRLVAPLGLPQRARHLIEIARLLERDHRGRVPADRAALEALPGIGPYTSGAILSLGLNRSAVMVDGPIARLVARFTGLDSAGMRSPASDPRIWRHAKRLMPARDVRTYHRALLDVVAAFCKPQNPRCTECPLRIKCRYPKARPRQANHHSRTMRQA